MAAESTTQRGKHGADESTTRDGNMVLNFNNPSAILTFDDRHVLEPTEPPGEPLSPLPGAITFGESAEDLATKHGLSSKSGAIFSRDPDRKLYVGHFDAKSYLRWQRLKRMFPALGRLLHW